jgi:hypothetical protein
MKTISDFLIRIAGWRTFVAALLVYLIFGLYIMPHGLARIQQLSRKKVEVLDLQFSYTPERARSILAEYTDESRAFTIRFNAIDDGLYPIVYTFLILIMMAWLSRSLTAYGVRAGYLHLLPFVVMLSDYSENTCIITMLRKYPDVPDWLVRLSSCFTTIKWSLLGLEALMILGGLSLIAYYRMSGKAAKV